MSTNSYVKLNKQDNSEGRGVCNKPRWKLYLLCNVTDKGEGLHHVWVSVQNCSVSWYPVPNLKSHIWIALLFIQVVATNGVGGATLNYW